ncbi:MAG: glycosyltransferase family 39 protein [Acidimicrobiia bacterium]
MTTAIAAGRLRVDREAWRQAIPLLILIVTWLALLAVLGFGWLPNDDGTLAEMAERIRRGQIPHVDFDDPYTGLLSYLNAFALGVFGENLLSLRYPYWLLVGLWMIAMLVLARRVLGPVESALAVAGIAFASVFTHISPMPTWYVLMIGTFAVLATVRFIEAGNRAWLVLAGALVGLAFLFKSTGLVFGLGIGLTLAVRAVRSGSKSQERLGRLVMIAAVLMLATLVSRAPSFGRYLLLVLPIGIVCSVEWTKTPGPDSHHPETSIAREIRLVSIGCGLPILLFGAWFWAHGAMGDLWQSLIFTPKSVIGDLQRDVGTPALAIVVAVVSVVLWRLSFWDLRSRLFGASGLVVVAVAGYILWPRMALVFAFAVLAWLGLALGTAYVWVDRHVPQIEVPLATIAIVFGSLSFLIVQFPASNLYYVVVATPLVAMAALHLGSHASKAFGRLLVGMVVLIGAMFGLAKVQGRLFAWGPTGVATSYVMLDMPRGAIRVPEYFSYYNDLVRDVEALRGEGPLLVAGPDSPEVYFLTEFDNPTRILFDSLSSGAGGPTTDAYLSSNRPNLLINNLRPITSDALEAIPDGCELAGTYGPLELYIGCSE